jgi:PAS domain S-box-containing protein/putative nucleotidyltransferase with HDIG domain
MSRVLIVDDEKSIRATLAEFVREDGHEVLMAEDAMQALQLLEEHKPDVVVSDIILPRVTGVALLKMIHEVAPEVQVVMITGEPTADTASDAVRLGAFDYLSKPITRAEFKSVIASAVRVSELARDRRRLEEENRHHQEHLEEEVKRKTDALRESEEKYRAVIENASEAIFITQDGTVPFANPSTSRLSGCSLEELRSGPCIEWVHPDDRSAVADRTKRGLAGENVSLKCEFRILRPDGEHRWVEIQTVLISWEGRPALLNFAGDITDRKLRELTALADQEKVRQRDTAIIRLAMNSTLYQGPVQRAFRAITEASARTLQVDRVSVWLFTEDRDAIQCMDLYELDQDGHTSGALLKKADVPDFFRALADQPSIVIDDVREDPGIAGLLHNYVLPHDIFSLLDVPVRLEGHLMGVICHEHVGAPRHWEREDITFAGSVAHLASLALEAANRRQAERETEQSEIRYRSLFEASPVSLWQEDYSQTKAFLEEIRDRGVSDMEEHLHDHPELVEECIRRIRVEDVNQATVTLHGASSKEEMLGNLARVIPPRSQPTFIPQLMAILEGKDFYGGTGIDRRLDGSEIHVAVRWMPAPGSESSLNRVLVSKIDITAAVEAEKSLQQALDGTIRAIGMTTETRDPYTAGHQRRVTELAVAIAQKMGLPQSTIEGIRAAGLMHDIGKLAIPAEILSKPSALNAMERALIESHPQAAYDILQTVTFPWPIARIVLQHHERIDGSGYPQGLCTDDILIEARILAVADTVEAMASHRPYREALGVDAALHEIEENRGITFDPDVVDACLHLFREGDFAFEDHTT